MDPDQNVSLLKKGYDFWGDSRASEEAAHYWFDLLSDDVKWRSVVDESTPGMEFAVDCDSKAGVIAYFQSLGKLWEMEDCQVEEYIAQNDRVVVIGTVKWKNRQTGKSVETKKVDIFRMCDGKIIEFCELFDTAKANAASVN